MEEVAIDACAAQDVIPEELSVMHSGREDPFAEERKSMGLRTQIKNAVGSHGKWKNELKKAIETGKIDVHISSTINADDQCSFGKWLLGPTIPEKEKRSAYYKQVRELHAAFHKTAAKCVQFALSGKRDAAGRMLDANGEFTVASAALTSCMLEWLIETDEKSKK